MAGLVWIWRFDNIHNYPHPGGLYYCSGMCLATLALLLVQAVKRESLRRIDDLVAVGMSLCVCLYVILSIGMIHVLTLE